MDMAGKIVAYCGIVCSDCSAYIATQSGDQSALERVAAQWKEEYNLGQVTIKDVTCDGCLPLGLGLRSEQGRKGAHCYECEIRACGLGRGVMNCAHCSDYACEKLESFFGFVPQSGDRVPQSGDFAPDARAVLDQIRAAL